MTADIKISPRYKEMLGEINELGKQFTQEIRNYLWDKYAVDGLSPRLIRKACEGVLAEMDKAEIEYIINHPDTELS